MLTKMATRTSVDRNVDPRKKRCRGPATTKSTLPRWNGCSNWWAEVKWDDLLKWRLPIKVACFGSILGAILHPYRHHNVICK